MHGDRDDFQANEYLAGIAKSSRTLAAAVLMKERQRTNDLRRWHFEVLEALVWGWHRDECRCPLEDYPDPVVRVRACSRALRCYVDDATTDEAIDPREWTRSMDVDVIAEVLKDTRLLRDCLVEAQQARDRELATREARWRRLVEENESGDF